MKGFLDWVLSQRYWLVLIAVVFMPVLPPVTAALLALDTMHRGTAHGAITAAIGVAVLGLLAAVARSEFVQLAELAAFTMFAGVAIGAIVRWAGGLTLGFQATVLVSVLVVTLLGLFGPEPAVLMAPIRTELIELLRANGVPQEGLDAVPAYDQMIFAIVAGAVFAQLVAVMFLGYWWLAMVRQEPEFGSEFRRLRLGRVLGIPAMILISFGLVIESPLVNNLAFLVLFAFLFQGLAVVHAWVHAKHWQPLLWFVYILMIVPWTWLALSAVGLLDNVFNLRAPLRAQS